MYAASVRVLTTGLLSALICFSPATLQSQTGAAPPLSAYGNCPAPSQEGVKVCTPPSVNGGNTIDAPFQLIASATSGKGQVRFMELWADGKKITQTAGTPFDATVTLAPGTHRIVVIELDSTNAFVASTPLALTVEGNDSQTCLPPAGAGVNVCDPQPNSCHTSAWTTISAAGTGKSGPVARMELWVNGVKIANFPGNTIDTNLYIADFSNVTVVEVDSRGASISSRVIVVQSCWKLSVFVDIHRNPI